MKMKIKEIALIKSQSEMVKARADITFDGFVLKGFKVIKNKEGKTYVTPPSYKAGAFWRELFHTEEEEDWDMIQKAVLSKFEEMEIGEEFEDSK